MKALSRPGSSTTRNFLWILLTLRPSVSESSEGSGSSGSVVHSPDASSMFCSSSEGPGTSPHELQTGVVLWCCLLLLVLTGELFFVLQLLWFHGWCRRVWKAVLNFEDCDDLLRSTSVLCWSSPLSAFPPSGWTWSPS